MKVKQRPEDFRVEELSRIEPGVEGSFSVYRLEKSGIGTPEALRVVAKAWRLDEKTVAYAGLKDRHALTGQMISVRHGPRRNFAGRGLKLNYLGRSERPAGRGTIRGNRFRIVVRDLDADAADRFAARLDAPFPNYYDDQRFGSLRGTGGRFVARALLAGDEAEALRLALAAGASRCTAYGEIDLALRMIHLAAYQGHVFNECLRALAGEGPVHEGVAGPYIFGEVPAVRIPLAAAGAPPHPGLDAVLAAEGVDRAALDRLPFRGGERDAVCVPETMSVEVEPDELNTGRTAVRFACTLPPGSYATMLIKKGVCG